MQFVYNSSFILWPEIINNLQTIHRFINSITTLNHQYANYVYNSKYTSLNQNLMPKEKQKVNLVTKQHKNKDKKSKLQALKAKYITKKSKIPKPKAKFHNQIKQILKAKLIRQEEFKQLQNEAAKAASDYQKNKKQLFAQDPSFRKFIRFQRTIKQRQPHILITKSEKSQNHLLIKKYQSGPKVLIINSLSCPKDVCDFEIVLLKGSFQIGFVSNKDIEKVMLKNSITLRSDGQKLRIGDQSIKIKKKIEYGQRVRFRISQYQKFWKLMIQDVKIGEGHLPWDYKEKLYFYIQLEDISELQIREENKLQVKINS